MILKRTLLVGALAAGVAGAIGSQASAGASAKPVPPPGPAPEGMVWIPGGEFSMGCEVPSEGICTMATLAAVHDAEPIHLVFVDGFWMDKTEANTGWNHVGFRCVKSATATAETPKQPSEEIR